VPVVPSCLLEPAWKAISDTLKTGEEISVSGIARKARVDRSFLYRHRDLTSFDPKTGDYASAPAATPVTVRQLLTHTSGLGYTFTSPIVRDFKPKNGDEFAVGPLLFQPGERWLYSTATDWVGRLVETVSGQTLEAYFNQHVLGPLKMTSTFFNVPDAQQARLVNFWRRRERRARRTASRGALAGDAVQWRWRPLLDCFQPDESPHPAEGFGQSGSPDFAGTPAPSMRRRPISELTPESPFSSASSG
jgi:CubicO group peptidase (beta-lactamase class C family)